MTQTHSSAQVNAVTYVAHAPDRVRGVLCENVGMEARDGEYWVRVYRPLPNTGPLPQFVKYTIYDRYTKVEYDDGCICYCYTTDNPIRAHARFERYSPDDLFQL